MNTFSRLGLRNATYHHAAQLFFRSTPITRPRVLPSLCLTRHSSITSKRIAPSPANKNTKSKDNGENGEGQKTPPEPNYWRSSGKLSILFTLQACIVLHFVWIHFYEVTSPYGASMLPTMYLSGEIVIISRHYTHGRDIKVGDLVCALHPLFPEGNAVIKRVIGMPGDFVQVYDGLVEGEDGWLNGDRLRMIKVPRGHCWLAGDNQAFSRDSRLYGPVPLGLVTGKVVWRVWPWERFGKMENTLEEIDETELAAL